VRIYIWLPDQPFSKSAEQCALVADLIIAIAHIKSVIYTTTEEYMFWLVNMPEALSHEY